MNNANALGQCIHIQEQRLATLAYELHHGPGQYLTSAFYHLDGFRLLQAAGSEDAWEDFDHGLDLLQRAIRELRNLINELRPPQIGSTGLIGAVENLIHENLVSHGLLVTFSHSLGDPPLSPGLESTVFRIVQESFTNIRRHSHSQKVRLEIVQDRHSLHIEVEDWGIGFDPLQTPKSCFGLEGIRVRALLLGGRAWIISRPREGALVTVDIPVPQTTSGATPGVADTALPSVEHPTRTFT
jgi:signal transduction histidine kinase